MGRDPLPRARGRLQVDVLVAHTTIELGTLVWCELLDAEYAELVLLGKVGAVYAELADLSLICQPGSPHELVQLGFKDFREDLITQLMQQGHV